jgi:hypothetical protein
MKRGRKTIDPPHEDLLSHTVTVRGGYVSLLKQRGISNIKERVIECFHQKIKPRVIYPK